MPLTPEDIESRTFDVRKRGYDKTQVDRFLGELANAYRMVVEGGVASVGPRQDSVPTAEGSGRRPLLVDPSAAPPATPPPQALQPQLTPTVDLTSAPVAPHPAAGPVSSAREPLLRLGTEVTAVLESAQQQADRIREEAESRAGRLRTETEEWSHQVTTEADRYAAARRHEADADRQEAGRRLHQAQERAAAAEWAQQEAERRLGGVDQQVEDHLDQAAREADQILQQAERAARARVEGVLADADRRLEDAAATLSASDETRSDSRSRSGSSSSGSAPRSERRRPPTSPVRGGRRRTDPPVIDLVRDHDPIIDLVEGGPRTGRAGGEAPLYPVADRPSDDEQAERRGSGPGSPDPLTALLSDAVHEATDADGSYEGSGTERS